MAGVANLTRRLGMKAEIHLLTLTAVLSLTLAGCDGNVSETARVLDVSRRWLQYRMKEWREDAELPEAPPRASAA